MQYVGKVFSTVSQLYKELNPATLSGAIDIIVVEGKDGELFCSPFHVRFGKLQLLRPSDKAVQVIVNDEPAEFYMKVGDSGEGFFVLETEGDVPSEFATSPLASPSLSFKQGEVRCTEAQERVFTQSLVSAQAFSQDPMAVITNPNVVFRMSGDVYTQGEPLVASLISQLAFGQPLQDSFVLSQPKSGTSPVVTMPASYRESRHAEKLESRPDGTSEAQAAVAGESAKYATAAEAADANAQLGSVGSDTPADSEGKVGAQEIAAASKPEGRRWWRWGQRATSTPKAGDGQDSAAPSPLAQAKTLPAQGHEKLGRDGGAAGGYMSDDGQLSHSLHHHMHYAKTLRLTSDQLKSLGLKRGANDVKFLVPSNNAYCEAKIFFYRHDTQVVISDIDGTITKSDALGHLFNMVGKDWTHQGVAKLYTDIASNGYEILYLTSRAIGQADGTRYFLNNVKQGQYKLPTGPLLLSPDRLFTSFHREVIMRRPHEFKMACLRDIKNLFGDYSPFYAGFGNRITDAMSYRSVNVPVSRICTIDPSGEIKLELLPGYKSSYVKMNDLVDLMFPALSTKLDPKFNDWEYWKSSLPLIDDE
ncbi:LNS2-domain-containing protein, partial [Martensiomyces pterosporus]